MSIIPDPFQAKVKLTVRVKDGLLELLAGVPFPTLHEGSLGDLTVLASAFGKDPIVAWLRYDGEIGVLPEGEKLLVGINPKDTPGELTGKHFPLKDAQRSAVDNPPWMHYVEVVLKESLVLLLHGTDKPTLADCQCVIPALEQEAESVNQAYSLVSIAFEPTRRAHTGNVFERVFNKNENGFWVPLDHLRDDLERLLERRTRFAWLYRAVAIEANVYPGLPDMQLRLFEESDNRAPTLIDFLRRYPKQVVAAFNRCCEKIAGIPKPPITLTSYDWLGWEQLTMVAAQLSAERRQLISADGLADWVGQSLLNIYRLLDSEDIFADDDIRRMMGWATDMLESIWQSCGKSGLRARLISIFEQLNVNQRSQLLQYARCLNESRPQDDREVVRPNGDSR